jgi:hypothetical protein
METFDTRDIYLAVALFTLGHQLIEVENSNPRRAVFKFEQDSAIDKHAELFFDSNLPHDIRTVLINFRTLKDRLYAGV